MRRRENDNDDDDDVPSVCGYFTLADTTAVL